MVKTFSPKIKVIREEPFPEYPFVSMGASAVRSLIALNRNFSI
jgi:hypothetical protein